MALPKWQRRLAVQGALLKPMSGDDSFYGVFPQGDQRRRPLAKVNREAFLQARAEGVITEIAPHCFDIAVSVSVMADRKDGNYQSSHTVTGERSFIDAAGHIRKRKVSISESPLARWLKQDPKTGVGWLSQEEFDAGERLRADYNRSVLTERITSDWEAYKAPGRSGRGRSREDAPTSALDAKDRVVDALGAVGPGLDRVLSAVCLRQTGLEAAERAENWPRRSGKAILKLALQRLAIHYGILQNANIRL